MPSRWLPVQSSDSNPCTFNLLAAGFKSRCGAKTERRRKLSTRLPRAQGVARTADSPTESRTDQTGRTRSERKKLTADNHRPGETGGALARHGWSRQESDPDAHASRLNTMGEAGSPICLSRTRYPSPGRSSPSNKFRHCPAPRAPPRGASRPSGVATGTGGQCSRRRPSGRPGRTAGPRRTRRSRHRSRGRGALPCAEFTPGGGAADSDRRRSGAFIR